MAHTEMLIEFGLDSKVAVEAEWNQDLIFLAFSEALKCQKRLEALADFLALGMFNHDYHVDSVDFNGDDNVADEVRFCPFDMNLDDENAQAFIPGIYISSVMLEIESQRNKVIAVAEESFKDLFEELFLPWKLNYYFDGDSDTDFDMVEYRGDDE